MTRWFTLTVLFALCASCQAATSSPSPLPEPSPSPPPPTPTPLPPVEVASYRLFAGPGPSEWRVIGLVENQGTEPVGNIEVAVAIGDDGGEVIQELAVHVNLSNLMPGESGPFSATFEPEREPSRATVEVIGFEYVEGQRATIEAELEEFFLTGNGELAALGFVSNLGREAISLNSLSFLGLAPDGTQKSLASMIFGPNYLGPGESVPFLTLAAENPGAVRWTIYHDALVAKDLDRGSLEMLDEAMLRVTAQGAPFVVGTIANAGFASASGSVLVAMYEENRLIGIWEIETPRPLAPGEQLSFSAFGFPGVNLRFDPRDPGDVHVETRVESNPAGQRLEPVSLPLDISSFSSVGSALFLRGTVQNPLSTGVESAAVYAEVRSTLGELISAGWSVLGSLDTGTSVEFVLDLPIPAGIDPVLTEYDLRAIALTAGE